MNDILEFLKSISDGEVHQLKNKDAFAALNGNNDEVMMVLKLKKQGLVDINEGFVGGHPAITGYYITDKGQDYIKKHTSKINGKIKKIFWSVITLIVIPLIIAWLSHELGWNQWNGNIPRIFHNHQPNMMVTS